jgi:hypothetical protein
VKKCWSKAGGFAARQQDPSWMTVEKARFLRNNNSTIKQLNN